MYSDIYNVCVKECKTARPGANASVSATHKTQSWEIVTGTRTDRWLLVLFLSFYMESQKLHSYRTENLRAALATLSKNVFSFWNARPYAIKNELRVGLVALYFDQIWKWRISKLYITVCKQYCYVTDSSIHLQCHYDCCQKWWLTFWGQKSRLSTLKWGAAEWLWSGSARFRGNPERRRDIRRGLYTRRLACSSGGHYRHRTLRPPPATTVVVATTAYTNLRDVRSQMLAVLRPGRFPYRPASIYLVRRPVPQRPRRRRTRFAVQFHY